MAPGVVMSVATLMLSDADALALLAGYKETHAFAPPLHATLFRLHTAMLVGAARTMWGMRASIASAFRGAFKKGSAAPSRQERDLDARGVLLGIAGLSIPMAHLYWRFTGSLPAALVAGLVLDRRVGGNFLRKEIDKWL